MSWGGNASHAFHEYVDARAIDSRVLPLVGRLGGLIPAKAAVGAGKAPVAPRRRTLVTVVIPCYGYGHFLRGAVASVLGQEAVDVQVVVVDDNSPDDTARITAELAAQDGRVQLVRNPVNVGHVRAFNRGLEESKGEFVVRLDADDLLTPGCLARAVAVFETFPSVGLVYGHPRHFVTPEPPVGRVGRVSWTVWDGERWLGERCRLGVNCITTPEAMVRASVFDEVGPLDTRLKFAQDMEMWCRASTVSDVAHVTGADQALHRDHEASMSATTGSGLLLDLRERRTVFDVVFDGPGSRLPRAAALHRTARRALADEAIEAAHHVLDRPAPDERYVADLETFAEETSPDALRTGRGARLVRRIEGRERRPEAASILVHAGRSLRNELGYVRWASHGV
jgi:hypothetical protein